MDNKNTRWALNALIYFATQESSMKIAVIGADIAGLLDWDHEVKLSEKNEYLVELLS